MTKKQAERIGLRVVGWCLNEYGHSKYYGDNTPLLETQYQSDTDKHTYGEFDRDEVMIYVFTRTNRTVACLVNTVIHEFRHYLQSPTWIGRYIAKYGESRKNPYEREAERYADVDTKRCMKDLRI
jgi:hypothetical protein